MTTISVRVTGLRELQRRFRGMPGDIAQAIREAMLAEAELIMTDSKENYVPVDTGALRTSGHVQEPTGTFGGVFEVKLGFGGPAAPYALAVHENPRSGKTGGVSPSGRPYKTWAKTGQWKYLTTPLDKVKPTLSRRIIRRAIRKIAR